jgi:hypothetical protein
MIAIALVLMATTGVAQGATRPQPLDCAALLAAPSPGIEDLCAGEEALRRAAATPEDRVREWRAAANAYARSVNQLQALDLRIHALERLVTLYGSARLGDPDGVEQALRGLVQMEPATRRTRADAGDVPARARAVRRRRRDSPLRAPGSTRTRST